MSKNKNKHDFIDEFMDVFKISIIIGLLVLWLWSMFLKE